MKKLDSLMSKTKFIFFYMLICFVMLYMSACTTPTQTSANKNVKEVSDAKAPETDLDGSDITKKPEEEPVNVLEEETPSDALISFDGGSCTLVKLGTKPGIDSDDLKGDEKAFWVVFSYTLDDGASIDDLKIVYDNGVLCAQNGDTYHAVIAGTKEDENTYSLFIDIPEETDINELYFEFKGKKIELPKVSSVSDNAGKDAAVGSMIVTSAGVKSGVLKDTYGMRGKQQSDGIPTRSLPISIQNAPEKIVSYAVIMLDPDSKPLCGYEWVHWLAANITIAEIEENASVDKANDMVQGKNDFGTTGYGGPTPPDKPHTYIITIFALDKKLDLKNGFSEDELLKAMNGHILAEAGFNAEYGN